VNNRRVDTRRLRLLLELSRLGSMRAVADETGVTTSTVSQQIAVLAREVGTTLIEPAGRRVRLTPAGLRLADHAVTILAAVEAARLDLDPATEPAGTVRVAGFATAVRESLLPVVAHLAVTHPSVRLLIHEHEPLEAFDLLATDRVDLALTYDYNLAPTAFDRTVQQVPLWTAAWGLGVRSDSERDAAGGWAAGGWAAGGWAAGGSAAGGSAAGGSADTALAVFARHRDHDWIVNSRNTADERVVRTLASMAGFEPRVAHRVDSLDLVQHLIVAGLGVGLLPVAQAVRPGVGLLALAGPDVRLRSYAVTRRGRADWPPLALILRRLAE
jgi:DNA-binding transcriptional LysR family regulator